MKRDMDLARKILLSVEGNTDAIGLDGIRDFRVEGHSKDEVAYHVMLLKEAGLIEAISATNMDPGSFNWYPKRLTWQGHEFLESSREESLWQKAKKIALEKTGGLSLDVLKAVLVKTATDAALGPSEGSDGPEKETAGPEDGFFQ